MQTLVLLISFFICGGRFYVTGDFNMCPANSSFEDNFITNAEISATNSEASKCINCLKVLTSTEMFSVFPWKESGY